MIRFLSVLFWLLSAAGAVAFVFLSGFYGWAAILIWTVLVLPCTLYQRRQLDGKWPPPTMVRLWVIAITLNLAAGIVPPFASMVSLPQSFANLLGWFLVVVMWSGLVAAVALLAYITSSAIRHSARRQASAA
jgi:hypothetical protein